MNFFDIIKSLYQKNKGYEQVDLALCITLNKWLGFDRSNMTALRKCLPFLYFIEPSHFYFLLFFSIPRKYDIPFLKKVEKKEPKEDALLDKIQFQLQWSNREMKRHKTIIEKTILVDRKYWCEQLGVLK